MRLSRPPLLRSLGALACGVALAGTAGATPVPVFRDLDAFDRCVRDSANADRCADGLMAFVRRNPKLALQAGKRARLQFHQPNAVPYFAIALREAGARTVCADEDAQLATVAGLALPPDYPLQAASAKLFDACYASFAPKVKAELATDFGGYLEKNVCPTLAARGDAVPACAPKATPAPAVAAAPAPLPAVDAATTALERVRVFRGPEGERVWIAPLQGRDDVAVVRFVGVNGPWNGRAFVHRVRSSNQGQDAEYTTERDGKPWHSVHKRGTGYSVFVPGQPEFRASYSDADSAAATPQELLKALP